MNRILALAMVLALGATGAYAKDQCGDDKGKFIKCPPAAAAPASNRCRDKTTKKFAKCSAHNTEPVPVKTK